MPVALLYGYKAAVYFKIGSPPFVHSFHQMRWSDCIRSKKKMFVKHFVKLLDIFLNRIYDSSMKTQTRYQKYLAAAKKTRERAITLYISGMRQSEIARKLGVSRQRIHQIIRHHD